MNRLFGFLFARPSFIEGVARTLDLGGTLQEYNSSMTPEQADFLALRADWWTIGEDFWSATDEVTAEAGVEMGADGIARMKDSHEEACPTRG